MFFNPTLASVKGMEIDSIVTEEFQFIDPISDFSFKKIFGNEREVLISFLNELLKGKKKIIELSFIKDVQPEFPSDRSILIDLHCIGDNGQNLIIEMQRVSHINFRERCVAYTSLIISNQTGKGKDYQYDLKEVIFIGILNFNFKQAIGQGHINEICLKKNIPMKSFTKNLIIFSWNFLNLIRHWTIAPQQ